MLCQIDCASEELDEGGQMLEESCFVGLRLGVVVSKLSLHADRYYDYLHLA